MVKDQVVAAYVSTTLPKCPLLRTSCCNFSCSSFQTHIIPSLVLFLHFLTIFFWLYTYFKVPQPKDGKNQLDFQTQNFMLNLLRKKFINKIKYSRSSPDPDFLGVTISNHVTSFRFLPISRHLQKLGKPKLVDLKQKNYL